MLVQNEMWGWLQDMIVVLNDNITALHGARDVHIQKYLRHEQEHNIGNAQGQIHQNRADLTNIRVTILDLGWLTEYKLNEESYV